MRKCYKCQGFGHIANDCPSKEKYGKGGRVIGEMGEQESQGGEEVMLEVTLGELTDTITMPDAWEARQEARSIIDMRRKKRQENSTCSCPEQKIKCPNCTQPKRKVKFMPTSCMHVGCTDENCNQLDAIMKDGGIQEVGEGADNWEKITLKIDSGAIDTCMPPKLGQAFQLRPSEMSKAGSKYRAANGSPIENFGERKISGWTDNWTPFGLIAQVADVRTPLGSVRSMLAAGNQVIFDPNPGKSMIRNIKTGKEIPIKERNGSYEVDLWVEADKKSRSRFEHENRFQELAETEEDMTMDFIRQDNRSL